MKFGEFKYSINVLMNALNDNKSIMSASYRNENLIGIKAMAELLNEKLSKAIGNGELESVDHEMHLDGEMEYLFEKIKEQEGVV